MCGTEVQIAVAAFLERCAQQRSAVVPSLYDDETPRLPGLVRAEAAGRALLATLVLPSAVPPPSAGTLIRAALGYLQTVITISTPQVEQPLMVTAQTQQVRVSADAARLLRDTALLLVLAAAEDSASDVAVELTREAGGARLLVESDRPGVVEDLPSLTALRGQIAACGGRWEQEHAEHGASWRVNVVVPAILPLVTAAPEVTA